MELMKDFYDLQTTSGFKEFLNDHPLERGFYRNSKGAIRFLQDIGYASGSSLFVMWATKRNALAAFKPRHHGGMSVSGQSVDYCQVAEWFADAEYLGLTPQDAGLVETKS